MDAITLLAQLVGGVGIVLLIATFQGNKRETILRVQIASCLTWTLYYILMGAFTGAGMVFISAIRTYVFERYRQHEWLFEVFIFIYAVTTLLTWSGWLSLLPFIGILLASTAMWQMKPQDIRMWSLTPTSCWLPYNFLSQSYMGMAGDIVTFTSVVVGIIRFDIIPWLRRRQRSYNVVDTDAQADIMVV